MFHILGFLFIIIIAVLIIGLSIISSVIRSIFRLGRGNKQRQTQSHPNSSYGSYGSKDTTKVENGNFHPKRKKVFSEDEGEYVDFEEVNDA